MKITAILATLVIAITTIVSGQTQNPINSNYLITKGISPRVLDAAVSSFMQDGKFTYDVVIVRQDEGEVTTSHQILIYDPAYENGMDIQIVEKSNNLSRKEKKAQKKFIEKNHYFSRTSKAYLYDESTLKFLDPKNDTVVLEYYYQKNNVDPNIKYIKRIRGEIYIVNDVLVKVILTNTAPLKKKVKKYLKTIYYAKNEDGGYLISLTKLQTTAIKHKQPINVTSTKTLLKYLGTNGQELSWEGKPVPSSNENTSSDDTINVKLGGPLPILGKEATKIGYKLPRPVGVAGFFYSHTQLMEFTGLSVGLDGGKKTNLNSLFALDDSEVLQSSNMTLAKADVWVFPFLNIMGIVGGGKNYLDGELVLNDELRDFFNSLPGWIGAPTLPKSAPIKSAITSEVYGVGATLAGGYKDFNVSVNYQLMFTKIIEVNTTNTVNIITPMVGYMSPFGVNFMVGAQGQFYNTELKGFIEFEGLDGKKHSLDYSVDFEPVKWNGVVGLYKGFAKHWELSIMAGFGKRQSITAVFGYRF